MYYIFYSNNFIFLININLLLYILIKNFLKFKLYSLFSILLEFVEFLDLFYNDNMT